MTNVDSSIPTRGPGIWPGSLLRRVPWWLLIILAAGFMVLYSMVQEEKYVNTLSYLLRGVGTTIVITLAAYSIALVLGLLAGLGRISQNAVIYTIATLYVEVMRGLPMLIIIIYMQFIVAPALGTQRNAVLSAIMGLAAGYGAYIAEVFRGAIESLDRGQGEAARSLGMSHFQAMRHIILPQAFRRALPALGNDFVAMLKDSSLASAIAVQELTKLMQIEGSRTFDNFRAFNAAAFLYLAMTLLLSLVVRWMEGRINRDRR
ncbi:amino acid ABC transporter permease [Chloroflexia bacterium SDU3-3]|nr:amino acid ABC transporter permease [Chloroflexia bacterium SDU3-3]